MRCKISLRVIPRIFRFIVPSVLFKERSADQCRWREGVGIIAEVVGCILHSPGIFKLD